MGALRAAVQHGQLKSFKSLRLTRASARTDHSAKLAFSRLTSLTLTRQCGFFYLVGTQCRPFVSGVIDIARDDLLSE